MEDNALRQLHDMSALPVPLSALLQALCPWEADLYGLCINGPLVPYLSVGFSQ